MHPHSLLVQTGSTALLAASSVMVSETALMAAMKTTAVSIQCAAKAAVCSNTCHNTLDFHMKEVATEIKEYGKPCSVSFTTAVSEK